MQNKLLLFSVLFVGGVSILVYQYSAFKQQETPLTTLVMLTQSFSFNMQSQMFASVKKSLPPEVRNESGIPSNRSSSGAAVAIINRSSVHATNASPQPAILNQKETLAPAESPAPAEAQKCRKLTAFGLESDPKCIDDNLIRSIKIHAPNCGEGCGGVRYRNENPNATYDIEVFTDGSYDRVQGSNAACKLALIWEPPSIDPGNHDRFFSDESASNKFHKVFTFNSKLLQQRPEKFVRYLESSAWARTHPLLYTPTPEGKALSQQLFADVVRIKDSPVSIILSNKRSAAGHQMRHTVWNGLGKHRSLVTGCGEGANNRIHNKTQCLDKYYFTIVIENDKDQGYYFSEKLVDAFVTATVPIMWGSGEFVSKLFDPEGIIFFQTLEDIHRIMSLLNTPEKMKKAYEKRANAIRCNYQTATQFVEMIYDRMVRYLVAENGRVNCHVCPRR